MSIAFASTYIHPSSPFNPTRTSRCPASINSTSFVSRRTRQLPSPRNYPSSLQMVQGETKDTNDKPTAKDLLKLYGGSYLSTSIAISFANLALFYFLIQAGVDVRALVNSFGELLALTPIGRPGILDRIPDTAGAFTLAYIAHKVVSPIRFPITVAATPVVASWFSKKDSSKH